MSDKPSVRNKYNEMPDSVAIRKIATYMANSALVARRNLASQLGQSYDGNRDLYTALGYPTILTFRDFWAKYSRQDIAARIVDAPVDAVWRKPCEIQQDEDQQNETPFEKRWVEIEEELKIYNYFARVDKLAGIGEYAVLFMGFDDALSGTPKDPVVKAKNLLYLRPYAEDNAKVEKWEDDKSSPRYGCPKTYTLTASTANRTGSEGFEVHHSRILHVTEGMLQDDIFGTSRLKNVYNRLNDLELIAGGSAEMFWRGAFPGLNFALDKDAQFDTKGQALTDLQDEIEEYIHGLKRTIRTQGMDVKNLETQIADPKGHADVIISLIAGAKGFPRRVLMGSEMGSLASEQDETNWNNTVDQRRKNFVTPWIVREFINKLIFIGVLPDPEKYGVVWPDIHEVGDKEKAEIQVKRAEVLSKYAGTLGAEMVVPRDTFLGDFLGYKKEEIETMKQERDAAIKLEEEQIEADRKVFEEEEARRIAQEGSGEGAGD